MPVNAAYCFLVVRQPSPRISGSRRWLVTILVDSMPEKAQHNHLKTVADYVDYFERMTVRNTGRRLLNHGAFLLRICTSRNSASVAMLNAISLNTFIKALRNLPFPSLVRTMAITVLIA